MSGYLKLNEVRKATTLRIGPEVYPMVAYERGFLLLIDNYKFDTLEERIGSPNEAKLWQHVYEQLGFKVIHKENLTATEMNELFDRYCSSTALYAHNALTVVILSHGIDPGIICCKDFRKGYEGNQGTIKVEDVLERFNACEALTGKPKMFFFSCCRGDDEMLYLDSDSESCPLRDIFVGYSTLKSHKSYRRKNGSIFGVELLKMLRLHAHDLPLKEIFKKAIASCEKNVGTFNNRRVYQKPEYDLHGWRKKLYFNPGLSKIWLQILSKTEKFSIKKAKISLEPRTTISFIWKFLSDFGPPIVSDIKPDTQFSHCGLKIGDIIFKLNNQMAFCELNNFKKGFPQGEIAGEIELIFVEFGRLNPLETSLNPIEEAYIFSKLTDINILNSIAATSIFNEKEIQTAITTVQQIPLTKMAIKFKGQVGDQQGWCILIPLKDKLEALYVACSTGKLNIKDYGRILSGGFGVGPPENSKEIIFKGSNLLNVQGWNSLERNSNIFDVLHCHELEIQESSQSLLPSCPYIPL